MIVAKLTLMFFQIGALSFGGGYVILALIFQNIQVIGPMSSSEFANLVALSQITPGPIAINAATYIGLKYGGFLGAVSSSVAVVIPSFIIVLIVAHFLKKFEDSKIVAYILKGIKPAATALILSAFFTFSQTVLLKEGHTWKVLLDFNFSALDLKAIGMSVVVFYIANRFRVSYILLVILCGFLGLLLYV